jgi:hypothetical protein
MVKVVVTSVSSFAILFIHYTSFGNIGHRFLSPFFFFFFFFCGPSKFLVRLFLLTCSF